jgi:hypothetical protein
MPRSLLADVEITLPLLRGRRKASGLGGLESYRNQIPEHPAPRLHETACNSRFPLTEQALN